MKTENFCKYASSICSEVGPYQLFDFLFPLARRAHWNLQSFWLILTRRDFVIYSKSIFFGKYLQHFTHLIFNCLHHCIMSTPACTHKCVSITFTCTTRRRLTAVSSGNFAVRNKLTENCLCLWQRRRKRIQQNFLQISTQVFDKHRSPNECPILERFLETVMINDRSRSYPLNGTSM